GFLVYLIALRLPNLGALAFALGQSDEIVAAPRLVALELGVAGGIADVDLHAPQPGSGLDLLDAHAHAFLRLLDRRFSFLEGFQRAKGERQHFARAGKPQLAVETLDLESGPLRGAQTDGELDGISASDGYLALGRRLGVMFLALIVCAKDGL